MKIDLHLHSKYSDKPVHWMAEYYPESLVEIDDIYKRLMDKGMDYATITDHNCIGGCLELVKKYPKNSFISCEFDVSFPEDGCQVHIPVYNITEQQFDELDKLRLNIYNFKEYLDEHKLCHTVAHMFYSVNNKLKTHHVELLLLMFKSFEFNGSRSKRMNDSLDTLLSALTPEIMQRLAEKHGMPLAPESWIKFRTAGSDDHTGLKIAKMYTETNTSKSLDEFLIDVFHRGKAAMPNNNYGDPESLAHSMHSVAYQQLKKDYNMHRLITSNAGVRMINQLLSGEKSETSSFASWKNRLLIKMKKGRLSTLIIAMLDSVQRQNPNILNEVDHIEDRSKAWMHLSEAIFSSVAKDIIEKGMVHVNDKKYLRLGGLISEIARLALVSSPYFVSYAISSRDEYFAQKTVHNILGADKIEKRAPRVLAFSDTFDDVNGVAMTMRMQLEAADLYDLDYSIVTCSSKPKSGYEREIRFKPVIDQGMPFYSHMALAVPPFLQILDYCYKHNPDYIIAETEGLMGLSAIVVGYILNKPVYTVYHTQFPQYVRAFTGKVSMENMTWDYVKLFHAQAHLTCVPSNWIKEDLIFNGLDRRKLVVYPRGIDLTKFRVLPKTLEDDDKKIRFIYVGRVSKEKGLELLSYAYNKIYAENSNVELDIIGDGPYFEELRASLSATNAKFLGYIKSENLAQLYSNADVFVFPSATDTLGNVVLEAQACGLPVIVTDKGGPQENLINEKTGLIFKADDADALAECMRAMMDKKVVKEFSLNAIEYMKDRSFQDAFKDFYDMIWVDYQKRLYKKQKLSFMGMVEQLMPRMKE